MNRKILFALSLLAVTTTSSALAALPPYYQSVREFEAVLASPELAQALGGAARPITAITRHEGGFDVTTSQCMVKVGVEYVAPKPGFAGPADFVLHVGVPTCLAF